MTDTAASVQSVESDADVEVTTEVASATPPTQGTSELEQRLRGQTAKVNTVTAERNALAQRVADLESGKIGADEALKAQLEAKDRELADLRIKAAIGPKMARFPKAAEVLGEGIGNLPDEALADLEARLTLPGTEPAAAAAPASPKPVPANAPDSDGDPLADVTREGLLARIARAADNPFRSNN